MSFRIRVGFGCKCGTSGLSRNGANQRKEAEPSESAWFPSNDGTAESEKQLVLKEVIEERDGCTNTMESEWLESKEARSHVRREVVMWQWTNMGASLMYSNRFGKNNPFILAASYPAYPMSASSLRLFLSSVVWEPHHWIFFRCKKQRGCGKLSMALPPNRKSNQNGPRQMVLWLLWILGH